MIDAMAPAMLERAVAEGVAPTLGELMRRGTYVPDCAAAFPSVTPVCAASITTGAGQERHHIPAMNWYHRAEARYVEYGSSFRASQRFGIARQLTDTVYNMNRAHLAPEPLTVFEALDDAGVRTAGTTYLIYRGRHRHEPQRDSALTRIVSATLLRHAVMGPRELFYADIFASRRTGCRSGLGMPGVRDQHSGCVAAHLVEHDLFDFLLLSLPDNDWHSHKHGPEGQLRSLALADQQLARTMAPAGGVERFLDDHAVIVMADHSQAPVRATVALQDALAELDVLAPGRSGPGSDGEPPLEGSSGAGDAAPARARRGEGARIAVCPTQRAAMVYVLTDHRPATLRSEVVRRALALDGVELVMWLERDVHGGVGEGAIARASVGELRFRPGGELRDARGAHWSVDGELGVLDACVRDGVLLTPHHPDALARAWSALSCPTSGDVLLSAAPHHEFLDWGRQGHVGGGSHGSLRGEDSRGALILCGVQLPAPGGRASDQWSIRDVAPLVLAHFGL
ncbi:MAG TPA: alkaline phosphatase family protein [Solirubrobacteraceae bacterium]|nr:alkaline phosphatase family protein [Solirubrobacteraceae bacterium]